MQFDGVGCLITCQHRIPIDIKHTLHYREQPPQTERWILDRPGQRGGGQLSTTVIESSQQLDDNLIGRDCPSSETFLCSKNRRGEESSYPLRNKFFRCSCDGRGLHHLPV